MWIILYSLPVWYFGLYYSYKDQKRYIVVCDNDLRSAVLLFKQIST